MAAIDFPASPTTGQTFAAPNGVVYQFTAGGIWIVNGLALTGNSATVAPGGDISLSGSAYITTMTLPSVGAAGQVWFAELTFSYYGGTGAWLNVAILANGSPVQSTTAYDVSGANTTVPVHWLGALTGATVFTAAGHPNGATGVHWNGDGSRLSAFRLS
jgi:hypothetical protein